VIIIPIDTKIKLKLIENRFYFDVAQVYLNPLIS